MSRPVLSAALAVLVVTLSGTAAQASYYKGGGEGIRVEMRVKGQKIVFAKVSSTFYCTGPGGGGHKERLRAYFGTNRPHPDSTGAYTKKIAIDDSRRFRLRIRLSDPLLDELFTGRIQNGIATGSYRQRFLEDDDCRTGGFLPFGSGNPKKETLRFRASRR